MSKLNIIGSRMLQLMAYAVKEGMAKNESDYLLKIKFPRTNISNVRRGHQEFTKDHILNACKLTGANANWIFGIESNMMRKEEKDPLDRLKQSVIELEALLSEKKQGKKKGTKTGTNK